MLRSNAGMNQKDNDTVLVLLVFLPRCFLQLSSDPDARHLGRFGPEGQVCSTWVWPRSSHEFYALFPSVVVGRTGMLGILVGMDQKVFSRFPVVYTSTVCNDRCHGL